MWLIHQETHHLVGFLNFFQHSMSICRACAQGLQRAWSPSGTGGLIPVRWSGSCHVPNQLDDFESFRNGPFFSHVLNGSICDKTIWDNMTIIGKCGIICFSRWSFHSFHSRPMLIPTSTCSPLCSSFSAMGPKCCAKRKALQSRPMPCQWRWWGNSTNVEKMENHHF